MLVGLMILRQVGSFFISLISHVSLYGITAPGRNLEDRITGTGEIFTPFMRDGVYLERRKKNVTRLVSSMRRARNERQEGMIKKRGDDLAKLPSHVAER